MSFELPDWLRGIVLLGRDGAEYRIVGVDEDGYLGVILKAAAEVTIPGDVSVDQNDSIREMQGKEGLNLRTVAVDANGQIIMVPRGSDGNYMAVDAAGYLGVILKAAAEVTIPGDVSVDQNDSIREMQGKEGLNLRTVAVDANGQIIMVPRGSTGNYLAVDATGFMTTVIKGAYGATLKTLATDDDGLLVAVLKDNSNTWGKKVSVGLGELAARLGSPMFWDKRGEVVKMQTFADGLGYCVGASSGAGSSHGLDTGVFQTGKQSYKLTTGSDGGKSAQITLYSDFSPSGRIGFEFSFSIASQPDNVTLWNTVWDGTYSHSLYMRWDKAVGKLQVYHSGAYWVDVCDFQLPAVPFLFVSVKVVADLSTQRWVRLLSRGVEYDISAQVFPRAVSNVHPYLTYVLLASQAAAVNHTIYIDRMIVTTNEP